LTLGSRAAKNKGKANTAYGSGREITNKARHFHGTGIDGV